MGRKKKRSGGPHYQFDVEIDLHGYTADEAIYRLEEEVVVHADSSLMVIHGHGAGVLRQAIREFARISVSVRSFSPGEQINLIGGSGVTIIYTR